MAQMVAGGTAIAAEPQYLLGSGDELRLKVYEWHLSANSVHEWTPLNGEYRVGADGTVALPLVGDVAVRGLTTQGAETAIAERLQHKMGLAERPDAAVEIVKFRPFYIVGAVNKPGAYPYRPGLTVLQALSIAGGLYRLGDNSSLDVEHGFTTAAGELRVLQVEYNRRLARGARLQAQLDGSKSIPVPEELRASATPSEIAQIMKEEQNIAGSRNGAVQDKIAAMQALRDLLNKEVTSLGARTTNTDDELKMVRAELQNVTNLLRNGLTTTPREFALRQNNVELQGRRLDLDTALLRAREDINRLDQQIGDVRNDYRNEVLKQRDENEARLAEIRAKIRMQRAILADYDAAKLTLRAADQNDPLQPRYSIIREAEPQKPVEVPATELSLVKPGDTVRIAPPRDPFRDLVGIPHLSAAESASVNPAPGGRGTE